MHRFYLPALLQNAGVTVITDPAEIHHMKDVLRLKPGDCVCVFDGAGTEAEGPIIDIAVASVRIQVKTVRAAGTAPGPRIVLACAIPKRAKFDEIIEKVTELGAAEIIPVVTARTEIRFDDDGRARRKTERYRLKAVSAAKQCGRACVPVIHSITPLAGVFAALTPKDCAVIPCLAGDRKPLREVLSACPPQGRVIFFIGPEGDFTPDEVRAAVAAGCIPVTLGPTVLKVDTAAITVVAGANLLLR